MKRKFIAVVLGALLGAAAGFVLGLIIGAILGGNFFESFQFNGVQGYEATGQLGAIIGSIAVGITGVLLALKITARKKKADNKESSAEKHS